MEDSVFVLSEEAGHFLAGLEREVLDLGDVRCSLVFCVLVRGADECHTFLEEGAEHPEIRMFGKRVEFHEMLDSSEVLLIQTFALHLSQLGSSPVMELL